jgi:hypothetical protein
MTTPFKVELTRVILPIETRGYSGDKDRFASMEVGRRADELKHQLHVLFPDRSRLTRMTVLARSSGRRGQGDPF